MEETFMFDGGADDFIRQWDNYRWAEYQMPPGTYRLVEHWQGKTMYIDHLPEGGNLVFVIDPGITKSTVTTSIEEGGSGKVSSAPQVEDYFREALKVLSSSVSDRVRGWKLQINEVVRQERLDRGRLRELSKTILGDFERLGVELEARAKKPATDVERLALHLEFLHADFHDGTTQGDFLYHRFGVDRKGHQKGGGRLRRGRELYEEILRFA